MANVLITKFREFTDVIMSLPVIYSACLSHKEHTFTLVTRPSLVSLFINKPDNLRVEGVDIARVSTLRAALEIWNTCKKTYSPDVYISLDNSPIYKFIAIRARIDRTKTSIVKKVKHFRRLIRNNDKLMLPLASARSRYREAFFRVGLPVQEHFHGLYGIDGKGDSTLFSAMTTPPAKGEKWIGIAPFAKHTGKAYPTNLMEQVIEILGKELAGVKIILFGGGERELDIMQQWAHKYPYAVSPAMARLGFPAELSLLSYLDVMLTMDSANMHLASLAGVPVITIWGATHPYCGFKGWHQTESATISLPMPCRPCSLYGDKECHRQDYHCITAIKPRFIADKIIAALQ